MGGKEVPSLRTESSSTYERPDGTMVTQVGSTPVNFRDARGDWQPINTDLRVDGQALENSAGPVAVELPRTLGESAVRVQRGAEWASFEPVAAGAVPAAVDGATATYPDALAGADAEYVAQSGGVKETIVIDKPDAATRYDFRLAASAGLRARLTSDGDVEVRHADGSAAFVIPAPTVQEKDGPLTGQHVRYELSADGATLSVIVDADWLASAELPVRVDPSVYIADRAAGCDIASGAPNTSTCGGRLYTGKTASPASTHRSLVRFDIAGSGIPRNAIVLHSRAILQPTNFAGTGSQTVEAHALTRGYTAAATWNSYNSINAWVSPGGDFTAATEDTESVSAATVSANDSAVFEISKLTQAWVDQSKANSGLEFKAADESGVNIAEFGGSNDTNLAPLAQIIWQVRTGAPKDGKLISEQLSDKLSASVNVANGNLLIQGSEINLPGVGLDLALGSSLNLQDDGSALTSGSFSFGSQFGLADSTMLRLGYSGHYSYAWRDSSGAWYRFDRDRTQDTSTQDGWTQPAGLRAHLETGKGPSADATLKFDESATKMFFHGTGGEDANAAQYQRLERVVDRNNNQITLNRSASGELTSMTDTRGRALTLVHETGGRDLKSVTDALGRQWKWSYLAAQYGRLPQAYTDPDGKITTYDWDASGRLSSVKTPGGRLTVFAYDSPGRVTSVRRVVNGTATTVGTLDATTRYEYSPTTGASCSADPKVIGRTQVTDARDKQTSYCHNDQGQVIETYTYDLSAPAPPSALAVPIRRTDATYDAKANVINTTSLAGTANAALSTFKFSNDGNNNPIGTETPVDPDMTKPLAARAQTTSIDYPQTPTQTQNQAGLQYLPTKTTDPQGVSKHMTYKPSGNLESIKDAAAGSTAKNSATFAYNARGQVTSSTDGNGNATTYDYQQTAPWNLLTVTPPVVSPLALKPISFAYDAVSRVKTITDGKGIIKTITLDGEDRTTAVALSGTGSGAFAFVFDADGNLTQRTEGSSTTTYEIDKLNRRTMESFPGSKNNVYAYDKLGNVTQLVDATSQTTSYTYDNLNRVLTVTSPKRTGSSTTDEVKYEYKDRATTPTVTKDTVITTYPVLLADGTTKMTKTTEYDLAGQPTSIVANGPANVNLAYTYTTGTSSSLKQTAKVQSQTLNGTTTNYSYSTDIGQLTQAAIAGSQQKWQYFYDNAGNRTFSARFTADGTGSGTAYAYNADNELCWSAPTFSGPACTSPPSGATTYSFDANGNQTAVGSTTTAYDAFDRLTSGTLSYLTPGNGELVAQGATSYQNSTLGLIRTTTSTTNAYTRDPSGAPVAQRQSGAKQFFIADKLGSTLSMVSDTGAATWTLRYDPDGNATTSSGTGPAPELKYAAGKDMGNGLYHFGARYYSPSTARWTQQDPLNQTTDLQQANRYAYIGGDPINGIDPTGLSIFDSPFVDDLKKVGSTVVKGADAATRLIPQTRAARCAVGGAIGGAAGIAKGQSAKDTVIDAAAGCATGAIIP